MNDRVYSINPECERTGEHIFPYDETFPICLRDGCQEGEQMVDYYMDLEEEMCTCDTKVRCEWHNPPCDMGGSCSDPTCVECSV